MVNIALSRFPAVDSPFSPRPWHARVPGRSDVGVVIESGPIGNVVYRIDGHLLMFETGECVWYAAESVERVPSEN